MTGRRRSVEVDGFAHTNPIPAASRIGDLLYSSVITGRDPRTGRLGGTLDEQAALMFGHLRAIVEAAGGTTADIIKVNVWLADMTDRDAVNREWVAMFPDPASRPARQAHAADLGTGSFVQCDFVAMLGADTSPETDEEAG